MDKEMIEFIANGAASGPIASKLLANGMDPAVMRPYVGKDGRFYINKGGKPFPVTNATLRYDEWKEYDRVIIRAAEDRLVGVADLISRGLTYSVGNGLAKTVLQYEDVGKMGEAIVSMDGLTRGKSDRPEYDMKYLPLPIVSSDFQINARVLAASRTGSEALDTVSGEQAGTRVAEKLETILFQGLSSYAYGGGTIYGYLDYPDRITGNLGAAWDNSAVTGADIIDDVLAMKQALIAKKRYGPWVLYIPIAYETKMDEDYSTQYPGKTIRQRILEISGIQDVKVAEYLIASASKERVSMVEMNNRTVRMVNGMGITPVEWQEQGGMVTQYKVMTIQVPQIRGDQDGNCGVLVYTEP